jgi:hypothetical protein
MKGDSIRVTARITPEPPQGSEVVFRLASVDSLRFKDTALDSLVVPVVADTASAKLWSYAYWGVADVTATYRGPDGDASDRGEVPRDIDDDGIADSWELSPEGGGAMNLGGSYQDQDWDEEASPGTAHNGDKFTKDAEYKGIIITPVANPESAAYRRLRADRKEFLVLVDSTLREEAEYAIGKLGTQLEIEAFPYTYFKEMISVFGRPGQDAYSSTAHVIADSVDGLLNDGFIWDEGVQLADTAFVAGETEGSFSVSLNGVPVRIYRDAIRRFWQANTFPEQSPTQPDTVTWPVPEATETRLWWAYFNNTSVNGDPDANDLADPFDLLSPPPLHGKLKVSNNDAYDGEVAGFSEGSFARAVVLHELGHALGMLHPEDSGIQLYPSPMRSGPGPGKTEVFDPMDITQVTLRQ